VLADFVTGFWPPMLAAIVLWLALVVAARVRQEDRKCGEFLRERRPQ